MSPRTLELTAKLLRFIASEEPLASTLRAFPELTREEVGARLTAAADQLSPAVRTVEKAHADLSSRGEHALWVFSDGAARGNPGPAGAGAVITRPSGEVLERLGKFLGRQTNNHAEYVGVILGLRRAQELGAREVEVFADSQLMIRQLAGEYKVKSETLRPLFEEARALLASFGKIRLVHIPREQNTAADEMSNRAIDERM